MEVYKINIKPFLSINIKTTGSNPENDMILSIGAVYVDGTSHRAIDVGSMYYDEFGYIPSLGEINNLIGYKPVAHTALADAINVVEAIKHKVKSKTKRKTS